MKLKIILKILKNIFISSTLTNKNMISTKLNSKYMPMLGSQSNKKSLINNGFFISFI